MLKVGQIVYCKPGVNKSKYNPDIMEGVISKVGRKYIEVKIGQNCRAYIFHKDTLKQVTDYTPDYYLYFDKQEILDERERNKLEREILKVFSEQNPSIKLTLEQLREIRNIIYNS